MKAMKITSWVLAVLVAALFLMAGLGKLTGAMTDAFAGWGYPAWFETVIGVLEIAGAIGLLIPKFTRWAILGLTGIMIGAAYTHLAAGEGPAVMRPLIFTAVMWAVWFLRKPTPVKATA